MKKLIVVCTILMLIAVVGVNAQTSNSKGTTDDKLSVTPKKSLVNRDNSKTTETKTLINKPTVKPSSSSSVSKTRPSTTSTSVGKTRPSVATSDIDMTKKLGTHAPEFNDPNYASKLEEWKKNYSEEYNAYLSTQNNSGNK